MTNKLPRCKNGYLSDVFCTSCITVHIRFSYILNQFNQIKQVIFFCCLEYKFLVTVHLFCNIGLYDIYVDTGCSQ